MELGDVTMVSRGTELLLSAEEWVQCMRSLLRPLPQVLPRGAALPARRAPLMSPRWFAPLLLLGCLPVPAQTPAANRLVPLRPLASEVARATEGAAAYIHTGFATGTGLLLPNGVEVVAARHTVLTPGGEIASQIGVGVPQAPLNNIVECNSVAEAQDPVRDLVLLRITSEAGAVSDPSSPEKAGAAPCLPTAGLPVNAPAAGKPRVESHAGTGVHTKRKRSRPVSHEDSALHATTDVPLHIVTDGPSLH